MLEVYDLDEMRRKEKRTGNRSKDEKIEAIYDAINNLIDILNDLKGDLTEVLNE